MISKWGVSKETWEENLTLLLSTPVKVPNFFWEIEVYLQSDLKPYSLTIYCRELYTWLPILYKGNLFYNFESYVRQCIFSYFNHYH